MKKEHFNHGAKNKEELKAATQDEAIREDALPEEEKQEKDADLALENAKLKEDVLRALAEAENVKKRCAAEIEKNNKYAVSQFAKDLLTVADNLERALDAAGKNAEGEGLVQGVKLTAEGLKHVFEKYGIMPMNVKGEIFDPNFHRVVQEVEDETKPAGEIVSELQKGYMIQGRLLREAMVVVARGKK